MAVEERSSSPNRCLFDVVSKWETVEATATQRGPGWGWQKGEAKCLGRWVPREPFTCLGLCTDEMLTDVHVSQPGVFVPVSTMPFAGKAGVRGGEGA